MSADSSAPAASPSSRLRLSVPVVSHVQIDSSELQSLLSGAELTGGYGPTTVLDVRADDAYTGGHVRGSVHAPFDVEREEAVVSEVLAAVQKAHTQKLIVLDSGAKQQAPVVAELLLAKLKEAAGGGEGAEPACTVYVLTSGFVGLLNESVDISADRSSVSLKAGAEKLIDGFDAAAWTAVAVPRTPSNQAAAQHVNQLVRKSDNDAAAVFVSTPKA